MTKPNPSGISRDIIFSPYDVRFDADNFDALLRSNGITFIHYKAILCPLGVTDRFDARSHIGHQNCTNGFIYKQCGEVTAFFSQNQLHPSLTEAGIYDGSTCQVTLPRYYDNKEGEEEVMIQHYDRFFLKDLQPTTVTTQRIEAHQSGIDRLQYPATKIEFLIDSDGKEYKQNVDFIIKNGNIQWLDSNRPGYDPQESKGIIYSVRYQYIPFYYVKQIMHEVRVIRQLDVVTGETKVIRMPYAILLQREFAFENEQRGDGDAQSVRVMPGPQDGGFGAR